MKDDNNLFKPDWAANKYWKEVKAEEVREQLSKPGLRDSHGFSPLHWAIHFASIDIIKFMLKMEEVTVGKGRLCVASAFALGIESKGCGN